jgi:hypothetical protein
MIRNLSHLSEESIKKILAAYRRSYSKVVHIQLDEGIEHASEKAAGRLIGPQTDLLSRERYFGEVVHKPVERSLA